MKPKATPDEATNQADGGCREFWVQGETEVGRELDANITAEATKAGAAAATAA